MRALFITGEPYSHIRPVKVLANQLKEWEIELFVIGVEGREKQLTDYGFKILTVSKPPTSDTEYDNKLKKKYEELSSKLIQNPVKGFEEYIEFDISNSLQLSKDYVEEIVHLIKDNGIDLLFTDAVDRHAHAIALLSGIPQVSYFTHNMYGEQFFEKNPGELYSIFMNGLKYEKYGLPRDYFSNFRDRVNEIYDKNLDKNDFVKYSIPLNQFESKADFYIVLSLPVLQNLESLNNKEYEIIIPYIDENFIEPNYYIKKFLKDTKRKVALVASGTIISFHEFFYKKVIIDLLELDYSVVISCGKLKNQLTEFIKTLPEEYKENIFLEEKIPQSYVLSKADLFISHAGHNSILEAIYYQVPLFLYPQTSEQKLNGLHLEDVGLGKTAYKINNKESFTTQILDLTTDARIKENLKVYSDLLVERKNSFEQLKKFIDNNK